MTGKKNGITSFEWTATTKYTVGKKTYSKPFYGQSLQLDGSNVAVGVFNNGFCKGNFSVLKHPPTPPHKK
ncbi:MAG: hypothetical protein COB66_07025 [Coxiella sp. (in: Bacteria)]|nr:MAG: hypothetical protein COB66_07025 [Coxiella sp. (in: g-proteobacteria)]